MKELKRQRIGSKVWQQGLVVRNNRVAYKR